MTDETGNRVKSYRSEVLQVKNTIGSTATTLFTLINGDTVTVWDKYKVIKRSAVAKDKNWLAQIVNINSLKL